MTNASREQADLDARDRRPDQGRAPQKADPLAELARIVGQDDPFRALLAARDEGRAAQGAAPQPSAQHDSAQRAPSEQQAWGGRVEPSFAAEPAQKPVPADAFDQYLASVEQDTHGEPVDEAPRAQDPEAAEFEEGRALRRVKPRRRLASVGAGIAVVAVAVAGALTYKGLHRTSGGGVPVVQADSTPLKVAPKVADGVEIPDQNRQIYDTKGRAKDGQIRIVNREEQPLDVAEAARAAQGAAQGGAQAGTTPGSGPFDAFGEPRKVRTIAVRPDAPPVQPQRDAQADASQSSIPTMTLPVEDAPKPRPIRQTAAQQPVQQTAQAAQVQAPPPAAAAQAAAPKPVAVKPPPKAAQRVASVASDGASTAAQDVPATTSATDTGPAVSDAPVSGFSVQLGVRSSAADARAALQQMQAKYGQLAGKPELIRQAEVNGKTIYRVRVGPLAKAEAERLCSSLHGEGGQCFVAKN